MEERKSIGIFGVQQGVGVTHLCTALTHYCADCLKSHTALVELSGNHELEELQKQQQGKWGRPDRKHYFANAGSDNMPEYIRQGYEYYIIDGGSEFYRIRREFLRCDRKLILVSLSPWKRKELEYFMSVIWEEEKCLDNVTFLAQFGMKKDKKRFSETIPHTNPYPSFYGGPASFKRSRAPVFKNFSLTYHERLSFWKRKVESRHVNLTETKNKKDE